MTNVRILGSQLGRIFEFRPNQGQDQDRKLGGRIKIRIIQVLSQKMRIHYLSFFMQKRQDQDQVQDRSFSDFQDSGSGSGSHFFWQDQDQKSPDPIITSAWYVKDWPPAVASWKLSKWKKFQDFKLNVFSHSALKQMLHMCKVFVRENNILHQKFLMGIRK